MLNPPAQARLRRLVSRSFTAHRVASMRDDITRLDRDEGPDLSFGGGIHHCLGAALARLEAQVMLPMLVRRFPNAVAAGDPVRRGGLMIRGYTSLPIALHG